MTAKVIRLPDTSFTSVEDTELLLERLRVVDRKGFPGFTLHSIERMIPHAASMVKHRRVDMFYRFDLCFCLAFLEDTPNPSLEELQLITRIMARWRANHERTIPNYECLLTLEEAETNRKIIEVIDRLIAKRQYSTDEGHTE
jgi:hypothetical protein